VLAVIKYIERNAVRAGLVGRAEDWQWGSAWRRVHGTQAQKKLLDQSPAALPDEYVSWINTADKDDDLASIRVSTNKGTLYGKKKWVDDMVALHKLESTLRNSGRPKKA